MPVPAPAVTCAVRARCLLRELDRPNLGNSVCAGSGIPTLSDTAQASEPEGCGSCELKTWWVLAFLRPSKSRLQDVRRRMGSEAT